MHGVTMTFAVIIIYGTLQDLILLLKIPMGTPPQKCPPALHYNNRSEGWLVLRYRLPHTILVQFSNHIVPFGLPYDGQSSETVLPTIGIVVLL